MLGQTDPSTATAILGGGLAAASCARTLVEAGARVAMFDKARGVGGRMAARRTATGSFDHGAQYFTVRDPDFEALVQRLSEAERVARWTGRVVRIADGAVSECVEPDGTVDRWVGVPRMNELPRAVLPAGVTPEFGYEVTSLGGGRGAWVLDAADGRTAGPFARVVVTAPAEQCASLLGPVSAGLAARVGAVSMLPCVALLLEFAESVDTAFDAAFLEGDEALAWLARDSSKPGRGTGERWVAHANAEWSAVQLAQHRGQPARAEDAPEYAPLLAAVRGALGAPDHTVRFAAIHRWRYARVAEPLGTDCLFDPDSGLGVAGDWCLEPRAEAAWVSGRAVARQILAADPTRAGRRV